MMGERCARNLRQLWRRLTLRWRCAALLRRLPLPEPFSAAAFCEELARQRRRPILLRPVGPGCFAPGVHAYLAPFPEIDVIFYNQATSTLHQEHSIVHEATHLVWEHAPAETASPELLALVFQRLDGAEACVHVLCRTNHARSLVEREAEALTLRIMRRTVGRRCVPFTGPAGDTPETDAILRRLRVFYEGSQG